MRKDSPSCEQMEALLVDGAWWVAKRIGYEAYAKRAHWCTKVDFLVGCDYGVVPIEVKPGKTAGAA